MKSLRDRYDEAVWVADAAHVEVKRAHRHELQFAIAFFAQSAVGLAMWLSHLPTGFHVCGAVLMVFAAVSLIGSFKCAARLDDFAQDRDCARGAAHALLEIQADAQEEATS